MRFVSRALLALAVLAFPAGARGGDDPPCRWCREEPARLAAFGAVSHGPFPFAKATSDLVAERLSGATPWMFVETAHFRIASNLGPQKVRREEREELERRLAPLRESIPELPRKLTRLDPWLRLHLFAMRVEECYAAFQRILGVTDADFPAERTAEGPYMGAGPYLGERDKFELLLHSNRATHRLFTREVLGITVTDALRWHFSPQHKMFASIPAEDSDLRDDRWLVPHTAHLLSHLFLCGYKDFGYDPPIWLDEGLAHAFERAIEPRSTTIDGDEGGGPHRGDHQDWTDADRRLVRRKKATPIAVLLRKTSFSDLSLDDHVTAWSVVSFLLFEHPEGFARFLGGVKGQLDEHGMPHGADLPGLQRRLLREIWGWSVADLEREWKRWVLERPYALPRPLPGSSGEADAGPAGGESGRTGREQSVSPPSR